MSIIIIVVDVVSVIIVVVKSFVVVDIVVVFVCPYEMYSSYQCLSFQKGIILLYIFILAAIQIV